MSEHKTNLCDGCTLWPCGTHAPIGVDGCIVTECANRKPTSGEVIATLKAQRDELLVSLKCVVEDVGNMVDDGIIINVMDDIIYVAARAAIANAEKDKSGC